MKETEKFLDQLFEVIDYLSDEDLKKMVESSCLSLQKCAEYAQIEKQILEDSKIESKE